MIWVCPYCTVTLYQTKNESKRIISSGEPERIPSLQMFGEEELRRNELEGNRTVKKLICLWSVRNMEIDQTIM